MPDSITENPPKTAVKIANMVFVLGGLFSLLIAAYAAYRIFAPIFSVYSETGLGMVFAGGEEAIKSVRTFYVVSIAGGLISAILFGFGLRLNDNVKVNLSLSFLTIGITLYAVETYLELSDRLQDKSIISIEKTNLQVVRNTVSQNVTTLLADKRPITQVLRSLEEQGIDASPNYYPMSLLNIPSLKNGLPSKNGKIMPIGGISNKMLVQKETIHYHLQMTDKYGFRNSNDAYDKDTVDVVLIGNSFTAGWGTKPNKNTSAVLIENGFHVINFGKGGNGPLLSLATLKEYARTLQPRVVMWFHTDNAFSDLSKELRSNLLTQYLHMDDFSQNLISRQDEINNVLIDYFQPLLDNEEQYYLREDPDDEKAAQLREKQLEIKHRKEFAHKPMVRILKLRNLRKFINLVPEPQGIDTDTAIPEPINSTSPALSVAALQPVYRQTLEKANRLVSDWNAKLYFVYLPHISLAWEGVDAVDPKQYISSRKFALRTATELGMPIIDTHKEVFSLQTDPTSLFVGRFLGWHYNAKGYRLVAEAIAERLRADGVLQ